MNLIRGIFLVGLTGLAWGDLASRWGVSETVYGKIILAICATLVVFGVLYAVFLCIKARRFGVMLAYIAILLLPAVWSMVYNTWQTQAMQWLNHVEYLASGAWYMQGQVKDQERQTDTEDTWKVRVLASEKIDSKTHAIVTKEVFGLRHTVYVLLTVPKRTHLNTGDVVRVRLFPKKVPNQNEPWQETWAARGIYGESFRADTVEFVRPIHSNFVQNVWFGMQNTAHTLRQYLSTSIQKLFPSPESTLLDGMLLGNQTPFDSATEQKIRNAGLLHLVVVSGSNITLAIGFLVAILGLIPRLDRRVQIGIVSIGVIGYALLVNGGVPAWRGVCMGLIGYWAVAKNNTKGWNTLTLAIGVAFAFGIFAPRAILSDPSYQLSFMATVAISTFSGYFLRWLAWIPAWLFFRESLAVSLAAGIGTLPLLALSFGTFAPLGVVSSALAGVVVGIGSFFAAVSLVMYPLSVWLGHMAGWPAYLAGTYILGLASIFGQEGLVLSWGALPELRQAVLLVGVSLWAVWTLSGRKEIFANYKTME